MKIFFLSINPSSFVKKDFEILNSRHEVVYHNSAKNIITLFNELKNSDLLFCWFASINFFIPVLIAKILSKKIVVVAGGYDVARVEEISYGSFNSYVKGFIVKIILRMADKVITISNSNNDETLTNGGINKNKVSMIYHGFRKTETVDSSKKKDIIITIGYIDEVSFQRKGIDRFLKLAEHMPQTRFFIIGKYSSYIKNFSIPSNVELTGFLDDEKFNELLLSAKVYIQFSRHEGFGCSVADAMQAGCVPVVSNSYALPEVVGDSGVIISDFNDYNKISEKIRDIFRNYNYKTAEELNKRVNENFSLDKRGAKLLKLIEEL